MIQMLTLRATCRCRKFIC